jgi:hypothetical protein
MPPVKCELTVRQKEEQISPSPCLFGKLVSYIVCLLTVYSLSELKISELTFLELDKTELHRLDGGAIYDNLQVYTQLLKRSPAGCNQNEPLKLKKKTTALWLNLKFVQFASEVVENLPAVKRRKLNERSCSEVVVDLGKILQSKAGTDFQITASCGRIFDVHRCILAGINEAFKCCLCKAINLSLVSLCFLFYLQQEVPYSRRSWRVRWLKVCQGSSSSRILGRKRWSSCLNSFTRGDWSPWLVWTAMP